MSPRTATLTNLDRSEYGTVTVDLDELGRQELWLSEQPYSEEREGLQNLCKAIMYDLADMEEEEG